MQSANRIAINTVVQYIQLIVNVLVGLLSVRLILGALGKSDYGIYSLVGGVIALVSFISASVSQTSIRYISISLASNHSSHIKQTVSSCFSLHLYLAFFLVAILELLCPFFFTGFLNIPPERIEAAELVYQCMVLTLFLNISNSPFTAVLYAHEKFIVTSSIAILNAVLKLFIAIYVSLVPFDKLMTYGILMMLITIIDVICYQIIVNRMYRSELSYRLRKVKEIKNMASFAGWTLFDTAGSMFTNQGYAILYNKFFGPVMNTVYGLGQQLSAQIYSVSSSAVTTFKPQVMKSYGSGEKERSMRLSMTAGKVGFFMMCLVAIPLVVMMPDVLDIWLKSGNYPIETIFFSRLMIIDILLEQLTVGLVYANQAIGKVKWFSIIVSSIRMMAIPASLLCFMYGMSAEWGVIMCLLFEGASSISRVFVMHRIADLNVTVFFKEVYLRVAIPFIAGFICCVAFYQFSHSFDWMVITVIANAVVYITLFYFIGFNRLEKESIKRLAANVLTRIKR